MTSNDEVLVRQARLQSEAEAVQGDLGLAALLGRVGEPVVVGSAGLGLMVWRDLDVTVICDDLDVAAVAAIGAQLAVHERVWRVVFKDDSGVWNTDPAYPDGLYLGVRYRSTAGDDWNLDTWFVDEPDRQPDLANLRTMPPRLTDDARLAILRIKGDWCHRPEYGRSVTSADIYTAVLDHGVGDLAGFASWVAGRDEHQPTT
ncbi:hypothetical protein [Nitriliruptor alkaliphilus]|uniref:hypothetical protein n=1 Tax=Nitriliruptor alkaliphilus TaxID=427918 RepID=UPI0006977441|nr:hypothetical protein [Nitriliruptor alkaliphilus]